MTARRSATAKSASKRSVSKSQGESIHRVTISLPPDLHDELDHLVASREFGSRSQAICEMIRSHLIDHSASAGDEIMMGTLQLVYDHSVPSLQNRLSRIQREHIDEVISSFQVLLEKNCTLEVTVLQGPARTLRQIADSMLSCRGVQNGHLHMITKLLPPIHGRAPRQPKKRP